MADKKNLEISGELYDAIQQLKQVFAEMSGKPIDSDEDVLSILVSGFIDSVMHEQEHGAEGDEDGHHGHGHHHHHKHGEDDDCCKGESEDCACKHGE